MQTQRRPAPGPAGWAWGQRGAGAGAMAPARPQGTRARGKVFCFSLGRPIRSEFLQQSVGIDFSQVRDAKNRFEFKAAIAKVHSNADGPLVLRLISADG
jgi:hypothetical protein